MRDTATDTDAALLDRYIADAWQPAFEQLVSRYAGMVYGTALRILGNRHAAEDITQDCFAALAHQPRSVKHSVAGWLHARAASGALNRLREEERRQARERKAAAVMRARRAADAATDPATWNQLRPILDAALDDLPDDLRQPIIMHYLQGADQQSVAEHMGVHQSTISRRMSAALDQLHQSLRKAGLALPAGALTVLLGDHAAVAAPPSLVTGLSSLTAGSTAAAVASGSFFAAIAGKFIVAAAIVITLGITGSWLYHPAADNNMSPQNEAQHMSHIRNENGKVWIDDVPPAAADGNGYIRGIETMLGHAGTPVDYNRLMGLSGMAFITQVDTGHRWQGVVDAGWWPLDPWGVQLRRDFLGRAVGYELNEVGELSLTAEQFQRISGNLPAWFRQHIEPRVRQTINAGRPVLAVSDFGFVITGYDSATDQPPIWGRCARTTTGEISRCADWPWGVIVLGERTDAMDAGAADIAALRYALSLIRDQAGPSEPQWRDRRFTGQKAFAAWTALLRNMKEPVEDRHHANMRVRLIEQRTAAVAYLRSVASRQQDQTADALRQAAAKYEIMIEHLQATNTDGLSESIEARRALADEIDRIAALELQAAQLMEKAIPQ
ncbi:MAG: RNA polymerase sigma factor [Phycisphaerales bacterium]